MARRGSILITGGAGYIGSHCAKAVAEAGFLPVCYDNLSTGHKDFVQWGPLTIGDVADSSKIAATLREHSALAVMHFAAFSAVGESVADPQKYYLNNVAGTLGLLRGMREAGCDRLVFSSTGAVYGNAGRDPIPESAAGPTVNPYGRSKYMIEQILADYRAAYRLNSVCLRYFNACGADASATIGELRDPETHLIPRALMALLGHVSDFAIFGENYNTPDGTAIRDYIHVDDLAAAHIAALEMLLRDDPGGVFNLGTGTGYSVKQVLDAIRAETGEAVATVVRERRPGDPPILVADPSNSESKLGFKATRSDLGYIIRSAWAWHQKAHPRRSPGSR
jgi:UDP-arabinose 4-epimerase